MIEVKCNGKIYKFPEGSEIIDQLDMQASEVTDDPDDSPLPAAPGLKVYTHDVAALALERFEDLLDEKDISVPCADADEQAEREDDPDNGARLYGSEYSELLDGIENTIIDAVMDVKRGAEIVKYEFSGTV